VTSSRRSLLAYTAAIAASHSAQARPLDTRRLDAIFETARGIPRPTPRWTTPGNDIHLGTRDLATIGQLMLKEGVHHGRRIVSARWVRASTGKQVAARSAVTGWHRPSRPP
jgi:hypothetical protein